MAQHRGRRSFRFKQNVCVIGTRLADEFTELRGPLRRKAIDRNCREQCRPRMVLVRSYDFRPPRNHHSPLSRTAWSEIT
jgi:hypothetical protein